MHLVDGPLPSSVPPGPLHIDDASVEEADIQSHIIEGLCHMGQVYLDTLGLQIRDLAVRNVVVEGVRSVGRTHVNSVNAREVDGVDVTELCGLQGLEVESLGGAIIEGPKPLSHQAVRSVVARRCDIREVGGIQDHDLIEEVGLATVARAGGIDLDGVGL